MNEETTQENPGSQEAPATEAAPVHFINTLPEELQTEPSLRNFTDAAGLAKSYVHAQKMIGADKLPLPGKSATDEEWNNVYQKLGRPDAANQYDFKAVQGFDEPDLDAFKQIAYDTGLNGKQAERMAKSIAEKASTEISVQKEKTETLVKEGREELEKEYGKAFDQKMKLAKNAVNQLMGSTDLLDKVELADGRLLGDHPEVIRMFVGLASQMGEDTLEGETTDLIMTPQEANRKLMEVTAKDTPYWDKSHPQHDFYVQEALSLRDHMVG
tara:strand:- start:218 stop:1027 length:810 start_codon:yes stop_codon:yes gene_type:complete